MFHPTVDTMPKIHIQGRTLTCESGANLRQVLLKEGIELYNGNAKFINCMGIGTCGTCAVVLAGHPTERNWKEKGRLSLPPHKISGDRRLACQIKVTRDLKVTKYDGFWGQGEATVFTPEA